MIEFESHWVPHSQALRPAGNIHVCKNKMNNSLKNSNLLVELFLLKYMYECILYYESVGRQ